MTPYVFWCSRCKKDHGGECKSGPKVGDRFVLQFFDRDTQTWKKPSDIEREVVSIDDKYVHYRRVDGIGWKRDCLIGHEGWTEAGWESPLGILVRVYRG